MTTREIIMEAAVAAGARGISIADFEADGHGRRRIDSCINRMVDEGLLHKGKIGHRTMRVFSRIEWANAFEVNKRGGVAGSTKQSRTRLTLDPEQEAIYPVDECGNPLYKFSRQGLSDEMLREGQMRNPARWNAESMLPSGAATR